MKQKEVCDLPLNELVSMSRILKIVIPRSIKTETELRKYLCPRLLKATQVQQQKKSKCVKQTRIDFITRNAPPYLARDCIGQRKRGNDNLIYVPVKDARGSYRWTLASNVEKAGSKFARRIVPSEQKFKRKSEPKQKAERKPVDIPLVSRPYEREKEVDLNEDDEEETIFKEWVMLSERGSAEKRADIARLDAYCRQMATLTNEDLKRTAYQKKLSPILFYIKNLIRKYDIDPHDLETRGTNPAQTIKNLCTDVKRLISLS